MGDSEGANHWTRLLPQPFVVLYAVATVTLLLAANPYEGVHAQNLVDPLVAAVALALMCWGVAWLFRSREPRRSVIATALSLPVLLSGYTFAWLRTSSAQPVLRASGEIFLLAMLIAAIIFISSRIEWRGEFTRFLNLFAVLCVLLSLPAITRTLLGSNSEYPTATALPDTTDLYRPDIYLVVLDAYTGRESLQRNFGFDNGPWLETLSARGFSFPDRPRSNYVKTFLSVGSMLNRDYYDELLNTAHASDREEYQNRMEHGQTIYDLKRLGYRFYYVGSSYPPMATNQLADYQYAVRPSRAFERLYFHSTALEPIFRLCAAWWNCRSDVPFDAESAAETEARIDFLIQLASLPGPKFVYAHWLLPHGPYRFDAECRPQPPRWTARSTIARDSVHRGPYIEQIRCTNRRLLEVVDHIQATTRESVIILQADHGHGRFINWMPPQLSKATREQVEERFDIFAAYAGPGGMGDSLAAYGTPVNVFRTLFRVLWGVDEPPIASRHYWSEGDASLNLKRVFLGESSQEQ